LNGARTALLLTEENPRQGRTKNESNHGESPGRHRSSSGGEALARRAF